MSKDAALEHLEHAIDSRLDPPARERRAQLAQAEALLYVGDQLERIADLLYAGFSVARAGDTFGDDSLFIEPRDPR